MAKKVQIRIKSSSGLRLIGRIYKGPADAAKEPVSNFIDEHINPANASIAQALGVCKVVFTIAKSKIVIEGPYGMTQQRFEYVLDNVLDSDKDGVDYAQIGRQAAGLFSWFQIPAGKCVYYSKAEKGQPTVKVTIKEGQEEADFETARKSESLKNPGMRFEISMLKADPTRFNSSLHPSKFSKFLGKTFRDYLKEGILEIELRCKGKSCFVEPTEIGLPLITEGWDSIKVKGDPKRLIRLELYFDPEGKGSVSIRHTKIPNVDDIREMGDFGLGIGKSIYADRCISGYIDADFLEPASGKNRFVEDNNWEEFLAELDQLAPGIEAELKRFREAESSKHLSKVQSEASEYTREILSGPEFVDLELLEGVRKSPEPKLPENGFDFVPDSARIDPGKEGHVNFKTYVGGELEFVSDGGIVTFGVSNPNVKFSPKRVTLRKKNADSQGIVTVRVTLSHSRETKTPVTLSAKHVELLAEATINFSKKKERKSSEESRGFSGTRINYQETQFADDLKRHSRLIGSRTIQINTLCLAYQDAISGTKKDMIEYVAIIIAKETFIFNHCSSDDAMERLLTFRYLLRKKLGRMKKKKI